MEVRELLDRTTTVYRPGAEVEENSAGSIDVWVGTPHEREALRDDPGRPLVDVHFFRCAVDRDEAERLRGEFRGVMDAWPPDPTYMPTSRLSFGPSYIELGAQIGTFTGQQDALRLMALGEVLGAWEVITPRRLAGDPTTDEETRLLDKLAGAGLVLISGYEPGGS